MSPGEKKAPQPRLLWGHIRVLCPGSPMGDLFLCHTVNHTFCDALTYMMKTILGMLAWDADGEQISWRLNLRLQLEFCRAKIFPGGSPLVITHTLGWAQQLINIDPQRRGAENENGKICEACGETRVTPSLALKMAVSCQCGGRGAKAERRWQLQQHRGSWIYKTGLCVLETLDPGVRRGLKPPRSKINEETNKSH